MGLTAGMSVLRGELTVEAKLGEGAMGAVYRVRDRVGHTRALKVLHRRLSEDATAVGRLVREARVGAAIDHPAVIETYRAGQLEDGSAFLLMEYLEGRDLRARMDAERRLSLPEAVRIATEAAEGLDAAHRAGLIHRDIKPANIFLCRSRARAQEHVKIVDFGLTRPRPNMHASFAALTATGAIVGTPVYLSPEQGEAARDIDGRADQYALAVTLYEMLTGEVPFIADSLAELVGKIYAGAYTPPRVHRPEIAPELERVIMRGLQRDREDRFGSIDAFAYALRSVGPAEVSVRPARAASSPRPSSHAPSPPFAHSIPTGSRPARWPLFVFIAAAIVIIPAAVLVGGWLTTRSSESALATSPPPSESGVRLNEATAPLSYAQREAIYRRASLALRHSQWEECLEIIAVIDPLDPDRLGYEIECASGTGRRELFEDVCARVQRVDPRSPSAERCRFEMTRMPNWRGTRSP